MRLRAEREKGVRKSCVLYCVVMHVRFDPLHATFLLHRMSKYACNHRCVCRVSKSLMYFTVCIFSCTVLCVCSYRPKTQKSHIFYCIYTLIYSTLCTLVYTRKPFTHLRAQKRGHQKVKQPPQFQDIVLNRRAREDEPVLCAQSH